MSVVQWPWPSDRIRELEAENAVLRARLGQREAQVAAVWAVVRASQQLSLTETSNSDILDALGTP